MIAKNKNVAIVACGYPEGKGSNRSIGNIFVEDGVKTLVKNGYEVHVIAGARREFGARKESGAIVHRLKLYKLTFNPLEAINIVRKIENLDLIHSHYADFGGFNGLILKMITKKPLIISIQGYDVCYDKKIRYGIRTYPFLRFLPFCCLKYSDKIIAASFFLKRLVLKDYKVTEKKIEVIYPILRDSFLQSIDRCIKPEGKIVLSVAYPDPVKGIDRGLRGMKKVVQEIPESEYLIIGEGFIKSEYMALAKRLGIQNNVKFVGSIPPDEIPKWYEKCSVFLMPSRHESFGMAKIEANACGRPVVVSNSGGTPEGIRHGYNGYIFSDIEEMSSFLIRLLNDEKLSEKMGNNGRKEARKYTSNEYIKKIEKVYTEL